MRFLRTGRKRRERSSRTSGSLLGSGRLGLSLPTFPRARSLSSCTACLSATMQPPDDNLRTALQDWITKELPGVEVPDPATIDALLAGNGAAVFAHLVARVVSPRRAALLRAHLRLQPIASSAPVNHADDADIARLEREAERLEKEVATMQDALRAPKGSRFGVPEKELRSALVDAAVDQLNEGAAICDTFSHFLHTRLQNTGKSKGDASGKLAAIVADAKCALRPAAVETESDEARARVAKLDSDIETLCKNFRVEDIAAAVENIAKNSAGSEGAGEEEVESPEEFAKRLHTMLQDDFLAAFAASQKEEDRPAAQRRLLFDDEDAHTSALALGDATRAIDAVDDTLSALTMGSRSRLARAMREARQIDKKLLPALDKKLQAAAAAQHARLAADLAAVQAAQSAELEELSDTATWMSSTAPTAAMLRAGLIDAVVRRQDGVREAKRAVDVQDLARRARREADARDAVDKRAMAQLLPALEQAAQAALHAHDKTVPAAAREVATAARVGAYVAARMRAADGT